MIPVCAIKLIKQRTIIKFSKIFSFNLNFLKSGLILLSDKISVKVNTIRTLSKGLERLIVFFFNLTIFIYVNARKII